MRLKVMAAERAPTIARVIQTTFAIQKFAPCAGISRAASAAPKKANGRAKSVCSILIISKVIFNRRVKLIFTFS